MRIRNTLMLLALALAIGAYIYFFERKTSTTDEAKDLREKLLRVKSDDILKIQLAKGETSIICEKNVDGTWKMTHPLKVRADNTQVQGIVSSVASLRKGRELDLKPGDSEKFGIDKPRAKLRLWHGDSVSEIRIGDETTLGDNIYVALNEEPRVYLVEKGFFGALDKRVADLRDKTVIEVAVPAVNRMKFLIGGKEAEAAREGEHWKLVSPVMDRADDDRAIGILNKLKDLRALEFVADEPDELEGYGLSQPSLEITLFTGEDMAGNKISFGEGMEEADGKVYAKVKGADAVYAVRKKVFDNLKSDIDELRSKQLVRAKIGDVDAITVTGEADVLELKKEGNDWRIVKPVEMEAERSRVDKLLGDITKAEIEEFPGSGEAEDRKYGLKKPRARVTLRLNNGSSEGIALGKVRRQLCYVKREGEDAILGVDKELDEACNADYLAYLKKEVLSFDRGKVGGLTLKRPDGEFVCKRGDDGDWSFSSPEEGEPGGKKLDSILVRLSHLRASSFVAVAGEKLKQYGLQKPPLEVEVELKDGEKHVLMIGKKCKDGYYAVLRDGGMVFTVPSSLVDALKADIVRKEEAG